MSPAPLWHNGEWMWGTPHFGNGLPAGEVSWCAGDLCSADWEFKGRHKNASTKLYIFLAMVHGLWGTLQSMAPRAFLVDVVDAHFAQYGQD